jgi:UDP-GlcNAc3NAcA epimerase
MKIATVLGARPQFIKAAPVSRVLRQRHTELLIHTGQHYDPQLSAVFFQELGLPEPDVSLRVGSVSHGAQTGRMLEQLEAVLQDVRPDAVLVYGDTNSTLAGALAAAKLAIPIVHVEAGLRSFSPHMPEEINRVLTDRLSARCCCPSVVAQENLAREGMTEGVHVVGDVMLDALTDAVARVTDGRVGASALGAVPPGFLLVTVHRAANTDDHSRLRAIVAALDAVAVPIVWPMHPRTRHALAAAAIVLPRHVHMTAPLGYFDLVAALHAARTVVTDSGGLQKEAYWLGVPCVTLRSETEWPETVASGWNCLVDADTEQIIHGIRAAHPSATARDAYGAPGAAERVVEIVDGL